MAEVVLELPLFEGTNFSYTIALEGNTYSLGFTYVDRLGSWVYSIKDSENNPLVVGQKLTPETALAYEYRLPNLSGYFYLKRLGESQVSVVSNLPQLFNLYYIYDDGE